MESTVHQTSRKATESDFIKAFYELEAIFEGAVLPQIVIEDTAIRLQWDKTLEGADKIYFGITDRSLNKFNVGVLKTLLGDKWQPKDNHDSIAVETEYNSIPVVIKIIPYNEFFKNPDFVYYGAGTYRLPNPMKQYVESIHHTLKLND